jgi:hypothetical protein
MQHTVKLGYNEQLGAAKFVCYNREFIITGVVFGMIDRFGTKKFVHYNREFVITKFVITKFDCTFKYCCSFFV